MAVTYKGNQIEVSMSNQKFSTDVVYARPEDTIKLDFDLKNVKVTFVNGDVDFIFSDGSVVSLASYGVLAFGDKSPKIYDASGNLISFDSLLQNVEVLKPEDAVLILANRDKASLVDVIDNANRVIEATDQDSSSDGGNPVAGPGDSEVPTTGLTSKIINPNGVQVGYDLKNGPGDYINNPINTTNLDRTTNNSNRLPGNSEYYEKSTLLYSFLYGDSATKGNSKSINGNLADYYGIHSGTGDDPDAKVQLDRITINNLGGDYKYRIFDGHSYDGKVSKTLRLDYSGGIFPESIKIYNIPTDKDQNGDLIYKLKQSGTSSFKLSYDSISGIYTLTQLDGSGKLNLDFIFPQEVSNKLINFEYKVTFLDPKSGLEKEIVSIQDVSITSVNQESDLNGAQSVLNKDASGISVEAKDTGEDINIFIGGSTGNKFSSKSPQNLVFTGGGNDIIDLSTIGASASQASNIIYGSAGYDIITGSGSGNDYLIFSNDKSYNKNIESPAVKDSYYETMKKGVALQFYLGMDKADVIDTWDKIGVSSKNNNNIRDAYTSNFVYSYNSLTVIGGSGVDLGAGAGSSIENIVGSVERDIFNLYFQNVSQHINISSGNPKNSNFGDEIVINGKNSDTVTLTLGDSLLGSLTSANYLNTSYTFDSASFSKFTGSDEQDYVYIKYNGDSNNYYSKTIVFDGGKESNNVVDFTGLVFDSSASDKGITFSTNLNYENALYRGLLNNRLVDYFYNFSRVIGSSGNDIFYGYTSSRKYSFDGTSLGTNQLSYIKSAAGISFDMAQNTIYKTNDATLSSYSAYASSADTFTNVQKITLSNYDDVVIGNANVNTNNVTIDLGSGNDTVRYDLDNNIDHVEVTVSNTEDIVEKFVSGGSTTNEDKFQKGSRGSMSYIGTSGDDIFYGADSKSTNFNGLQGNNTLSYKNATLALNFDLSKNSVSKGGFTDTFKNINNFVGGSGNDIFSFGKYDPTKSGSIPSNLTIDGGGGRLNTISFNQVILSNLSNTQFALTFEMPNSASAGNKISFYDKNNVELSLAVQSITSIQKIEGTTGNDLFIASEDMSFNFDGGRYDSSAFNANASSNNANIPIYGNTLSYKNVTTATNLTFDLKKGLVTKSLNGTSTSTDTFANIQGFIGGEGDDVFNVTHSLGDTSKYFDGGGGSNILSYEYVYSEIVFDLAAGEAGIKSPSTTEVGKDVFKNFNIFAGGYGKNIFVLSEVYNLGNNSNLVSVGNTSFGKNYISFANFASAIGESSTPFELTSSGSFVDSKTTGATTYSWVNVIGFVGSDHDDFFAIKDDKAFDLDGGKGTDTLTYADLVSSTKITVNVFTGSVVRDVSGVRYYDTISHLENLILGAGDDTVVYSAWDPQNSTSNNDFISIDGGQGSNTLDFSTSSLVITAEISAASIAVKESSNAFNTTFSNFNNFKASRANTTFIIDNESNGIDVTLQGNSIVQGNIGSVVDLRNLQGDLVLYNFLQADVLGTRAPSDYEGRVTWNSTYVANLRNSNITKFVFNADNNTTVYGSRRNNTFYSVEGTIPSGKDSILSYADPDFRDILKVYINDDQQVVNFVYNGTSDHFKGFNKFFGSAGDDTFLINDVNSIPNDVLYDGGAGNNTLSFAESKAPVEIDVSLDKIQLNGNSINITNIESLVLSNEDDVVNITTDSNNKLLFTSIDGGKGNNKINITSNQTVKFNEQGTNEIVLSKNSGLTKFSNFQEIRTSTTTGNEFYGSITNNIKFAVEGSSDTSINFVSYEKFSKLVKINFYDSTALKITGKSDSFEGIQYFVGSSARDIFALDTSFTDNLYKGVFTTVYINYKNSTTPVSNGSQDTVSIVSGNSTFDGGISFNTNTQTMSKMTGGSEVTSVEYKWVNVDTIEFTSDQTVYVSYDKDYNYREVSTGGTGSQSNNAVLSFDKNKSVNYKADAGISVIIDFVNLTASISRNQSILLNNIKFSDVTEVVATGNSKDVIYGGSNLGVKYKGISEYTPTGTIINTPTALPTLDYSKFSVVSEGITVNFNSDNTATILKPLQNQSTSHATDSIEYIQTIIGTNGIDTFILADNSNQQTYKIFIDGGTGVIDTVDLSNILGDRGVILDASTSDVMGTQYHYSFKNINSFLMGDQDDTFKGALSNDTILGPNSNKSLYALNIDGAGGTNILDYQSNFTSYTAADSVSLNIDFSNGIITKSGLVNNKRVTSSDRVSAVKGDALINFDTILLDGAAISNTLIVSDGSFVKNLRVNAVIGNASKAMLQNLSFEKLNLSTYVANVLWEDNKITAKFNDVNNVNKELASATYIGFNNITLAGGKSTLIINSNVSNFYNNGSIRGVGSANTLKLISNVAQANSSVNLDLSSSSITFDPDGKATNTFVYQLTNVLNFNMGFVNNVVSSSDVSNYNIEFSVDSTIAEINYRKLSSSSINLNITSIDSVNGAVSYTATKSRNGSSTSSTTDVVKNVKKITLSDNDDRLILNSIGSATGKIVTIDGAGGVNTVSLAGFSREVSLDIGSSIKVDGFDLENFSNLELTDYDDVVRLALDSQLRIDGGKGFNTVDYTALNGLASALILSDSLNSDNIFYISVTKNAQYIDTLVNFGNIILPDSFNNHIYSASVTKYGQAPLKINIDFNSKDINSGSNTMNYGGIAGSTTGISATIEQATTTTGGKVTNKAVVQRDNKDSNSIIDTLIGVNVILGTGKGDIFTVNTNVKNLTIDAIKNGSLNIDYKYDSNNFFGWDLNSKSVSYGSSIGRTDSFLHFNGIQTLTAVIDPTDTNNNSITNTFYIYDLSNSYIITADPTRVKETNSIVTLDFGSYSGDTSGSFVMNDIRVNSDGSFYGRFSSSNNSNNINYTSINNIEGSNIADTNNFSVKLNASYYNIDIRKQGKSTIVGKHSSDSIKLSLVNASSTVNYQFNANFSKDIADYFYSRSSSGSSVYGDIVQAKNISNIVIDSISAYSKEGMLFYFSPGAVGAYKMTATSAAKNTTLQMHFDDYLSINVNTNSSETYFYDNNLLTFSAVQFNNISIFGANSSNRTYDDLNTLNLSGNISLSGINNTYYYFNVVNVQDGNSQIKGGYSDSELAKAPLIDLSTSTIIINNQKINFSNIAAFSKGNVDININLPISSSGNQFIAIDMSGSNAPSHGNININTPITALDGNKKSIVIVKASTIQKGIYMELSGVDTTSFGIVADMSTGALVDGSDLINVHNVTAVGAYEQFNNFYIKYGPSFQYYSTSAINPAASGGTTYGGYLQYINVGSTGSLVLDYTSLEGNAVSLEGISAGNSSSVRFNDTTKTLTTERFGLYTGFNGVDPDWTKGKGQLNISVDAEGLFNNTTILAPNTGIQKFNVTAGFFRGFLAAKSNHTFVIDGSKYRDGKINVSNGDVSVSFEGNLFQFLISFANAKDDKTAVITNYELQVVDRTKGSNWTDKVVYSNLHWKINNVGSYEVAQKTDNTFNILESMKKSLVINGGEVMKDFKHNQYNTLNLTYAYDDVNLTFSLGSKSASGDFKTYSSNITGTINNYNVTLINFSQISFGDKSTSYSQDGILPYSASVYITLDFFPNFSTVTNNNSGIPYRSDPNLYFKLYKSDGSKISFNDSNYFNQTLDLTSVSNITQGFFVEINKTGLATFWKEYHYTFSSSSSSGWVYKFDIDKSNNSSFTAQNFTVLNLPTYGATVIQEQLNANYKITYSGTSDNIYGYNSDEGNPIFANNSLIRMVQNEIYTDYLINVNTVLIYKQHISINLHSQMNDTGDNLEEATYIIDAHDDIHNNAFTYSVADVNNFNLVITGIGEGGDRTLVTISNVSKFNISTDGISHYRVAFVDSDAYIDNTGNEKNFDIKGYFALEDTNTGKLIYFSGEDLSKFSRVFDELLNSKGNIDKFSSYKQMVEALENNTKSNDKYEEPKDSDNNSKAEDSRSSYENSNHAYVEKSKPENDSKDKVLENGNESNNKLEEHNDNNIDNHILNIVDEEKSNNAYLDIKASDVLDGLNHNSNNLDNLSNDVFKHLASDRANTIEDHSTKESFDNTINSMKELASVVEKSSLEINLVIHDTEYNHEDPTSKLDNMLHKENSLNGHNHK